MEEKQIQIFQDGGMFYEVAFGRLVADYSFMVKNDYDIEGALAARKQFLHVYGRDCVVTFVIK